jgi:beta-glucosidase
MARFPDGFIWGTATAAHQVEGNNTNSDFWAMEHTPGGPFREPSGDACDHYRLFREDIRLLRELGFNAYRFSIEWARVEPEPGFVSKAALRHYADVLAACHENGLTPIVTLHHFTSPRWLMKLGGWEGAETPARFAAYSRAVMEELGSLIPYVCTINEANIPTLFRLFARGSNVSKEWLRACARDLSTTFERFKPLLYAGSERGQRTIMAAHEQARAAIKSVRPRALVGVTHALQQIEAAPGGESRAAALWAQLFESYLPSMVGDDFAGVQNYSRTRVGPDGAIPLPADAERTQMGYEYCPEALEGVIRAVAKAGIPMIVTENGVATDDDSRRVEFIRRALAGVQRCLADGLDVRGYVYWSALDNFEWMSGYPPTFGLIAVDRDTQTRHVKPSARFLGDIARRNETPE